MAHESFLFYFTFLLTHYYFIWGVVKQKIFSTGSRDVATLIEDIWNNFGETEHD